MKINVKKTLNKNVVNKLTKLIKPNKKLPRKITVLICVSTFEGYGSLGAVHKVRHARGEVVREGVTVCDRGRGVKSM